MNRTEALTEDLYNLQRSSLDIEACAIFAEDGLVLASSLPPDMVADHTAAMTLAMLSTEEVLGDSFPILS